ncbi:MAG: YidC/Oxa1 family membrane protein insertase [Clostridiales bacterium]|nr:YidC/Oxa1 family membrane protein insertase [Clostridiales bacterium]
MEFVSQIWLLCASTGDLGFNPWAWLKYGFTWAVERSFDITMAIGLPSYALAIFFFTIVIKILLQPAMTKQQRTTRQMGRLQPKLQEIQKKYAGNQQRIQQETMKIYKEEGVSPFSSCLPMLLQMPIIIALFQALRVFVPAHPEYYSFLWITDLSHPNSAYPGIGGLILPIIAGLATFIQQYLSLTNKNDQTQKMMLYVFPIMFIFMTRSFPAFLALYWSYYSLVGAAIQFVLNKRWAKDDARAEEERRIREEDERRQKKIKKAEQKGQVFVEEDIDNQKDENTVTVGGVDYILPPGYTLRDKKVKAHPYSNEEETITVAVLPDGREKPLTSLKKSGPPPPPALPSFGFGRGNKKE